MKTIPLTRGMVALVDDEDHESLSRYKWTAFCPSRSNTFYAVRVLYKQMIYMHRVILNEPNSEIDHRNGRGLDNQRKNLRPATRAQNIQNSRPQANRTSGYKGVYWDKQTGKWRSEIMGHGKRRSLGRFVSEHDAALAYNEAARRFHGEFAWLNSIEATV